MLDPILKYSVNTWHQGFLDKLYASTNAPGVAADLILSVLNTNLHVYQVSPALTLIEKHTSKTLASLFGFTGPRAGGISVQGGSASNATSIIVARNTLYPDTKVHGYGNHKFILFTSAHGHYSIEKAAQLCGFGSSAVWSVPVDSVTGRIIPSALESLVLKAKAEGRTPFYVNATAGTTVLGSFDPFPEIADICQRHKLWMHVDASWGGPFVFSPEQKHKLAGTERANSIAINPHKMMGVPVTCSFLLGRDMRQFHRANTLPAGYLFHNPDEDEIVKVEKETCTIPTNGFEADVDDDDAGNFEEVWDLADLTLQCGRRGDSLKLFISWVYYGSEGYASQITNACAQASYMASLIEQSSDLILVSENPPPCLQVCFYYAPARSMAFENEKQNSKVTELITKALVPRGFMIDFAPGDDGRGKFFRCVVNVLTKRETVEALVQAVLEIGPRVVEKLKGAVPGQRESPVVNGATALNGALGGPDQRKPGGPVPRPPRPGEHGHEPVVH